MEEIIQFMQGKQLFQEGGRACYLYPNYTFCSRAFKPHKMWANHIPIVSISKNHKVGWFFATTSDADFGYALERALKTRNFLGKTEKEITKIIKKADKLFSAVKWNLVTDTELAALYDQYIAFYHDIGAAPTFMRQIDRALIRKFKEVFKDKANFDEALAAAAYPTKLSYGRQEEIAVLKAAIAYAKKPAKLEKLASQIAEEFATSSLGYFDETMKNVEHYVAKIKEESAHDPKKKLGAIKNEEKQHLLAKKLLKKEFPSEIKKCIDIAGRVVFSKDHYKFSVNKLQAIGEPLFQEISNRKYLPTGVLKDMTAAEISDLLSGKGINNDAMTKRIECHVIVTTDKAVHLLVGDDARTFESKYLKADEGKTEFKGRVACKGKGKGIARVVLSPSDFGKMNQGDILVVMNTSPDFVPIMKKAAAIVAEEGGITGHVSVVSREFGIPCVVGIGKITEMVKDGYQLDIDAEKGVVKILTK